MIGLVSCKENKIEEKKSHYSVVFLYPDTQGDWAETSAGAMKAAEDFKIQNNGISIDFSFCTAEGAIDQSEKLTYYLNAGIDGICIAMPNMQLCYPYDNDDQEKEAVAKYNDYETAICSLAGLIKNCVESGIAVVTIGSDQYQFSQDPQSQDYWGFGTSVFMEQPSRLCFVGSDNFALGRRIADIAIEAQDGYTKIYGLGGWLRSQEQRLRRQGIKEVISENVERGAELVDGNWGQDSHFYPFDVHLSICDEQTGAVIIGKSCLCEEFLKQSIGLMEKERIEINTYIGLWKGSNAISNVFKEIGWNDADTNLDHFSILCGESKDVIAAVKEHYATCAFIEDRYEWGYQAAKTLIDIVSEGSMPETDHLYTPFYIIDLSNIYDFYSD